MNKVEFAFIKSHIRQAIEELESANKINVCIDVELINSLKQVLQKFEETQKEE